MNTMLSHMFLLDRTPTRVFYKKEQIHHMLTMYGRINQTYVWYLWVLAKTDSFENNSIAIFQNFMNQEAINHAKISVSQEGKLFNSSTF